MSCFGRFPFSINGLGSKKQFFVAETNENINIPILLSKIQEYYMYSSNTVLYLILTQGGKGSSEGKKVQQILTWKFVIGMSTKFKFPKSKKIHEAIFEIAVDTHSLFCPFWQIFLPVYNLPSILASWIVLLFANLNSIDIPIANIQVRICWTFFPSELPFPSWVT